MHLRFAAPKIFGSSHTLATFVLVVVVARFNSWDHLTFFKTFQTLGIGVRISIRGSVRVSVRLGLALGLRLAGEDPGREYDDRPP